MGQWLAPRSPGKRGGEPIVGEAAVSSDRLAKICWVIAGSVARRVDVGIIGLSGGLK
jgi:hypothetical protein